MNILYLDKNNRLAEVARRIFGYQGKKYRLIEAQSVSCESHWDGGSRTRYAQLDITTGQYKVFGQSGTMFDRTPIPVVQLSETVAVISHSIFCGKDMGIIIYLSPQVFPKFLPDPSNNIPPAQMIVLLATMHYKSSYGGVKNLRFVEARRETGITQEQWDTAKNSLIEAGYLNRAGAITTEGRNIAKGNLRDYRMNHDT